MEKKIESIITLTEAMEPNGHLNIVGFGKNKDLSLDIWKDEDFDRETEAYNLAAVSVKRNGSPVYDTGDLHITDGSLYDGLARIYETDFSRQENISLC